MRLSDLVPIGRLGKPRGLRGAFFVSGRCEPIPPTIKTIHLTSRSLETSFHVAATDFHNGRAILRLAELQSREELAPLAGAELFVDRDQFDLQEQDYLWQDLIERDLIDCSGSFVGKVKAVENFGASDIVRVENPTGATLRVPVVRAYFNFDTLRGGRDPLTLTCSQSVFEDSWEGGLC